MESYHYSGWPLPTNMPRCNSAPNSDQLSPFSLPLASSDPPSLQFSDFPLWPATIAEDKDRVASASKSHSQAEKRRRDRINAQLATLRKLIPMSDKVKRTKNKQKSS